MSVVSNQSSVDTPPTAEHSWTWKQILAGGVALSLGAVILGALWVPRSLYTELVVSRITSAASSAGLNVVVQEPQIGFISFSCQQVDVWVPRILSTIPLQNLSVQVDLPSLAVGALVVHARATIWSGAAELSASYSLWSQTLTLNAQIKEVQLHSVAPLQALGIGQGTLTASIREASLVRQTDSRGIFVWDAKDWSLALTKAEKAQDTFFQLPRALGGGFIAIPAFEDLDATAGGDVSSGLLRAKELSSSSSLGSVTASGEIATTASPATIVLSGAVSLSDYISGKYGPFLPMISGNALTSEDRDLSFSIRGPLTRTEFKLSRKQ